MYHLKVRPALYMTDNRNISSLIPHQTHDRTLERRHDAHVPPHADVDGNFLCRQVFTASTKLPDISGTASDPISGCKCKYWVL
jgi:hypothetical protein